MTGITAHIYMMRRMGRMSLIFTNVLKTYKHVVDSPVWIWRGKCTSVFMKDAPKWWRQIVIILYDSESDSSLTFFNPTCIRGDPAEGRGPPSFIKAVQGASLRELWLSVVIIRLSLMNSEVHLPRSIHTGGSITCSLCVHGTWSVDAHSTLASSCICVQWYHYCVYISMYWSVSLSCLK